MRAWRKCIKPNGKVQRYNHAVIVTIVFDSTLSCFSHVQLFATTWTVVHVSYVHGILQARVLKWVTKPSSRGSSWPRNRTHVSCGSWIARGYFYLWVIEFSINKLWGRQLHTEDLLECVLRAASLRKRIKKNWAKRKMTCDMVATEA